ncbi:macrolide ABC transporter ATP-binding protein/permease [Microbacterium protaetiae]|uniref:Macrolide ABC transporter ATP-binding protein/permease n=1 Tax=Microbacterium protaetiae TaxID=2509458 RepID=A0A4P6EFJ6_9MICO|nr:ATP-binding cassette domain-containing protein [Microbacterium protaetiae]QAY60183.1 macrolide ABC transporter ATP-binding protein/permease [Microbacterium protaetiae]
MTGPLIRLRGVGRSYGTGTANEVEALRGVDLDIHTGEFVAIVGPSGGGKSTLLAVLGLLDRPTTGSYELTGVETTTLDERQRTRLRARRLGFVFQAFHLLDRRPLADSVEMGLLYRGVARPERRARADAALQRLGIAHRSGALARDLSGGQRQRVAIARALANDTTILLADEPTGNLDSHSGEAVLDELRALHSDGATVIVVTHSEHVAAAADRVIQLADGAIVGDTGSRSTGSPAVPGGAADEPVVRDRVRWRDLWRDAVASVLSRRAQTAALALAVALAVGLIVVSLGLGQTARAQVADTFDSHANREVTAQIVASPDEQLDVAASVRRVDAVAGVDAVSALLTRAPIHVAALGETATVTARLVAGDFAKATESRITWAGSQSRDLTSHTVLLGRTLANNLGIGPLDAVPTIRIDGARFGVVGIVESSDRYPDLAGQVVGSLDAPLAADQWEENITIALRVATGAAQQVGGQLPVAVDPFDPDRVAVEVPVDASTVRAGVESGVQIALAAFAALAVLIAVATLANAIGMSVVARRGEFGLRRAVGAQSGQVAALVASESAVIGFVGGVLGLVLGIAAILGFTMTQRWMPVFDLRLAPLAVAAGVVLAALSSVIGAVRAARVHPAIALRE